MSDTRLDFPDDIAAVRDICEIFEAVVCLCESIRDIRFESPQQHIELSNRLYKLSIYHRDLARSQAEKERKICRAG